MITRSISIVAMGSPWLVALLFAFLSFVSVNSKESCTTHMEETCPAKIDSRGATPGVLAEKANMEEIHGVKIWRNPPESVLSDLGVSGWKKWSGEPSKFPWTFDSGSEKMYLLKGKVKVYRQGYEDEEEPFEIGGGDLVEFPNGMKIIWEVIEAVEKHYFLF